MNSAKRFYRKFRASDGRIKLATLIGVSSLVAAIALLVGVLPAIANNHRTDAGALPVDISLGGGSGGCEFVAPSGLPSAARFKLHINNPVPGITTYTGADGTTIEIDVDGGQPKFRLRRHDERVTWP